MSNNEIDKLSGIETTGHEWDGIKELNNPLPRWWLWTFYATVVFSIGYMIYYPAIPLIETSTTGLSGVTPRSQAEAELAEADLAKAGMVQQILDTPLEEIRSDDDLFRFAAAGGESLYKVYCTQCHGSGAAGAPGYPNLNDDDWIWGGDLEAIYTTIAHGVRNDEDDLARLSMMPAYGVDGLLSNAEIYSVAHYVSSLSNQEHDAERAVAGAEIYTNECSFCHGDDGAGIRELGAPNLSDQIWLYGGTVDQIASQVQNPQHGVMPPWIGRLGEASIKQLAVYIHSLGGGEQEVALAE